MCQLTIYPHGTFSWAKKTSTDQEKAESFYTDLFGWTKEEIPIAGRMTYTIFKNEGEHVVALLGMDEEMQTQGTSFLWSNCADLGGLVQRMTERLERQESLMTNSLTDCHTMI